MTIKEIKNSPQSKGKKELLKRLSGGHLTHKESIHAKCFECSNGYIDGKNDCEINDCPLYEYMPYGSIRYKNPNLGKVDNLKKFRESLQSAF